MPKVDPQTGEPLPDDPDQPDEELRGGQTEGDIGLQGASETGGANPVEHKQ